MGYRIEKEGYEYRGVKLGQKCIYFGEESTVIGFDESDDSSFIAIRMDNYDGIYDSECATVVLEGHEKYGYDWVCLDDIELLPYEETEEAPSPQISPIHAIDILEDEIEAISEVVDVDALKECLQLIKENYIMKGEN